MCTAVYSWLEVSRALEQSMCVDRAHVLIVLVTVWFIISAFLFLCGDVTSEEQSPTWTVCGGGFYFRDIAVHGTITSGRWHMQGWDEDENDDDEPLLPGVGDAPKTIKWLQWGTHYCLMFSYAVLFCPKAAFQGLQILLIIFISTPRAFPLSFGLYTIQYTLAWNLIKQPQETQLQTRGYINVMSHLAYYLLFAAIAEVSTTLH